MNSAAYRRQLGRIDGVKDSTGGAQNTDDLKVKTPPGDASGGAPPPSLSEVKAAIDGLSGKVDDMKSAGGNEGLTTMIDGVKTAIGSLAENLDRFVSDGPPADWSSNIEAIGARMDALEAAGAMPGGPGQLDGVKSAGMIVTEDLRYKSYNPATADEPAEMIIPRGRYGKELKIPSMVAPHGYKTGEIMSGTAYGLAPNAYAQRPGIITPSLEAMDLASRIMYVPAPGAVNWIGARETDISVYGNVTTTLAVAVTNPSTTCTVNDATGFLEGAPCRFWNAAGDLILKLPVISVDYTTNILTFAAGALAFVASIGWRVTCDNFGAVSQGAKKAYSHLEIEPFTETFKTIPVMLAVTEQMINTAPALTAWIEQRLKGKARRNLSQHLLHGDGTKVRQLAGFDNYAGALSFLWSSGLTDDTRVDALLRAIAMIPWSGQIGVVLNKLDLMKIGTSKGTDGHYIKTTVFGDLQIQAMAGRMFLGPWELILDDACPEGDFYVINLSEASELVDQQRSQLAFGYIGDQFGENAITARYEDHLIHSIQLPAFVLGEFDAPPP